MDCKRNQEIESMSEDELKAELKEAEMKIERLTTQSNLRKEAIVSLNQALSLYSHSNEYD